MKDLSLTEIRQTKLNNIAKNLGITYLDSIMIIKIDDSVDVACWVYDTSSKTESIFINPSIIDNTSEKAIEMIIRHEALHRALFNYFNYKFTNEDISNIVLDIVINKILYLAYKDETKPMFDLYNDEALNTELVLCSPYINQQNIKCPIIKKLWEIIWLNDEIQSPETIYYNLIELEWEKQKENTSTSQYSLKNTLNTIHNPFRIPNKQQQIYGVSYKDYRTDIDKKNKALEEKIITNLIQKLESKGQTFFNEYYKPIKNDNLDEFIKNIKNIKKLSKITNTIKRDISSSNRLQVYPMFLSRLGIIYNALGVNEFIPLYWNRSSDCVHSNMYKMVLYIDTSGSMFDYVGYISWIIKQFDDFTFSAYCSKGLCYCFDTKVYSMNIKDIKKGRFFGGGNTDFNAPINHFISLKDGSNVALIFTDGKSKLDSDLIQLFKNHSDKKIYTIYFSNIEDKVISSLDTISEKTFSILVD